MNFKNIKEVFECLKNYKPHWAEKIRYEYALNNLIAIYESSEQGYKTERYNDDEEN